MRRIIQISIGEVFEAGGSCSEYPLRDKVFFDSPKHARLCPRVIFDENDSVA